MAQRRLDSVAYITMGQAPEGESYNLDGIGVPLIAGAGDFGELYPRVKKFTTAPRVLCQQGDIILGVRATIGEKVLADHRYCLGRGVAALRPREGLDHGYLWHWLTYAKPTLAAKAKGATFKQVTRQDIGSLHLDLPTLTEQRRVSNLLDRADAVRRNRRESLRNLESLTQSLFLEMFGDPGQNPKGWPRATLAEVIMGCSDGPHVSPEYVGNGVPFLSTRHVRPGAISWCDLKYITESDAQFHWKKCKPERGDILYTKGGTTGFAAAVSTDRHFAVWVHVAVLKPNRSKVDSIWLEAMLNTDYCYRQSQILTHGIANRDLGLTRMVQIQIFVPPLVAQEGFARRAAHVELLKSTYRLSRSQLDEAFASLQRDAFGGAS